MKQHRHYGQYIHKAVVKLKKEYTPSGGRFNSKTLVWDELDREYEIHVNVKIKKKAANDKED